VGDEEGSVVVVVVVVVGGGGGGVPLCVCVTAFRKENIAKAQGKKERKR